jgi:hypothetical protein
MNPLAASHRLILLDFVNGKEQNCENTIRHFLLDMSEKVISAVSLHNNHIIQNISGTS